MQYFSVLHFFAFGQCPEIEEQSPVFSNNHPYMEKCRSKKTTYEDLIQTAIKLSMFSCLIYAEPTSRAKSLNSPLLCRPGQCFFKPRQIVRQKRCYVGQGEFQTEHQTNHIFFFLKIIRTSRDCVALKTIQSYCTLIDIKLR